MDRARWIIPRPSEPEVLSLARQLGTGRLAAQVLWNRGYRDADAARLFLSPSLDDLHDPFLLAGMREAVERLGAALERREKVLLYGDYDVDGTSSIVILRKAIELAGGIAGFHVPNRLRDGYGMRPEVIEAAARDQVGLLISVDTGIRAAQAVRHANQLGLDVIVTDHHLPESSLPPAVAVLNPNRPDCPYPEKNLCGAGVAFKLAHALLLSRGWPAPRLRRILESFLKLVAISTVADAVPLTGENRILVQHGLRGLRSVRNPGLRALLKVSGFDPGQLPSSGGVAFRIAPRINAAGRMADAGRVIELFLTADEAEAGRIAEELNELNRERQQAEAEIFQAIMEECARRPPSGADAALLFTGESWHKGVVGIVASRVVERFHRPVFVMGVDSELGLAQGSGRSILKFHLLESLEAMPDLFLKFGGHRQAAGVTLEASRVPEFRERWNRYAAARLSPEDLQPKLELEAQLDFREIQERTVTEVLALAPFGYGNPQPLFAALNVQLRGAPALLKEKHLRVLLHQNGLTFSATGWNLGERIGELVPGERYDAALGLEADDFAAERGLPGWCLTLKDFRPSSGAGE